MRALEHSTRKRHVAGFAIGRLLVWTTIGFVAYSGYCFLPAWHTQFQLEGGIENILKHGDHTLAESFLRERTLKLASSLSVPVTDDGIAVRVEKSPGERTLHVELDFPVTVSYLGADRVLSRRAHVQRSYTVNEAEEAQRVAQNREQRRREARDARAGSAQVAQYQSRVKAECGPNVSHVFVTFSDGTSQNVPCSTASRW